MKVNSDFQSLNIAIGGSRAEDAIDFSKIMGPPAAASEGGSQITTYEDDTATQDVNERRFMGTYNGAAGTFVCGTAGGGDCSATTNNKGEVTVMVGDWTFTPVEGATSDVVDANYLAYGFWLKRTTDADGVLTYDEVETYAMAVGHPMTEAGLGLVQGSATYEGGSAGVYVKNVQDNQGNITSATSGHFTADVVLTANFGGGNVSANQQFTIDGDVTNFVLNGQFGQDENDWAVKLGPADFSGGLIGPVPRMAQASLPVPAPATRAVSTAWPRVTARRTPVYGMECSTVSSAATDHDSNAPRPISIRSGPVCREGRVQRALHGRQCSRWIWSTSQ